MTHVTYNDLVDAFNDFGIDFQRVGLAAMTSSTALRGDMFKDVKYFLNDSIAIDSREQVRAVKKVQKRVI